MEEMEKRAEELADKMKSGAVASKEDEEVAEPTQLHMPKFKYDNGKTMDENASYQDGTAWFNATVQAYSNSDIRIWTDFDAMDVSDTASCKALIYLR